MGFVLHAWILILNKGRARSYKPMASAGSSAPRLGVRRPKLLWAGSVPTHTLRPGNLGICKLEPLIQSFLGRENATESCQKG